MSGFDPFATVYDVRSRATSRDSCSRACASDFGRQRTDASEPYDVIRAVLGRKVRAIEDTDRPVQKLEFLQTHIERPVLSEQLVDEIAGSVSVDALVRPTPDVLWQYFAEALPRI